MGGKHAGEPKKDKPLKPGQEPKDDSWPGGKGRHAKGDGKDEKKK
ncbi:hypothetical protein [Nonomuraea ferruginea]|uniref:Uncharacterized protein n=1 Tax=Nonomuraea ferruginea TaxID=46174 RepID=A0ABT4SVW7_9ACTN|nr:hypothetical protein [Nonomuraea ferruginea]MDA0640961.1 hypothetical protein [Nonomuraea ferruginea]